MTATLTGITRDNANNLLGSCEVYLMKYNSGTHLFTQIARTTSDPTTAVFSFTGIADTDSAYNIVAFKDGTPHVYDCSDRNLTPVSDTSTTTWDPSHIGTDIVLTGGNLIMSIDNGPGIFTMGSAIAGHVTGKYYFEITVTALAGGATDIGFADATVALRPPAAGRMGGVGNLSYRQTGAVLAGSSTQGVINTYTVGDIVGLAVDLSAQLVWGRVNGGNWNNDVIGNQNPVGNVGGISFAAQLDGATTYYPSADIAGFGGLDRLTANFGGSAYQSAAPTGYLNW